MPIAGMAPFTVGMIAASLPVIIPGGRDLRRTDQPVEVETFNERQFEPAFQDNVNHRISPLFLPKAVRVFL